MSVPQSFFTPARRRFAIGATMFAAFASIAAPSLAATAPASAPAARVSSNGARTLKHSSSAHQFLATQTHVSLARSLDAQRHLAAQAHAAMLKQKRQTHARVVAATRASRARAHKLRVWHDSHVRLIPIAASYSLSARFGERSNLWGSGRHTGLDFDARYGSTIRSTRLGVVSFAGWDGPYGNCVIVNHGNGLQTRYAHMSHISVRVGEFVWAGQQVGRLGGTGNVTGPHLHFEVISHGVIIDPAKWLW
jgi:murein DD-endopeptidase MepM/ murein hydrolase activator NlpD